MRYFIAQAVCQVCGKFTRGEAYTDESDARMLLKQDHMEDTGHWIADEVITVQGLDEDPKKVKKVRKNQNVGKVPKL